MKIPHSEIAIELGQYMASFFISEARKNFNSFDSEDEIFNNIVENNAIKLTKGPSQDIYIFER